MREYNYPIHFSRIHFCLGVFYAIYSVALLIILILLNISFIIENKFHFGIPMVSLFMIVLLWLVVALPLQNGLNSMSPIIVTQEGLRFQLFTYWFRWIFVPWNQVIDVVYSPVLGLLNSKTTIVHIEALPLWNKIFSWRYYTGFVPGIGILSSIYDYDELIAEINERLKNGM